MISTYVEVQIKQQQWQTEITFTKKSQLIMENVSYHLHHNLMSSNSLLKNILIQMQKKNYNFTC